MGPHFTFTTFYPIFCRWIFINFAICNSLNHFLVRLFVFFLCFFIFVAGLSLYNFFETYFVNFLRFLCLFSSFMGSLVSISALCSFLLRLLLFGIIFGIGQKSSDVECKLSLFLLCCLPGFAHRTTFWSPSVGNSRRTRVDSSNINNPFCTRYFTHWSFTFGT